MKNNRISERDAKILAELFPIVYERLYDLVDMKHEIEGGCAHDTVDGFDIEYGIITVSGDMDGCNCCPRDTYYEEFPLSALWSDGWLEELKAKIEVKKIADEEEKMEKKAKQAKKKEEKDKKEYFRLKEKFDG